MIINCILTVLLILMVIGLIVFFIGIKNAELVDPKEPFLRGDYDPNKDPMKAK